jgi:hypothetical protein
VLSLHRAVWGTAVTARLLGFARVTVRWHFGVVF